MNQVYQREIVEVPFVFPDGTILSHPALVVSCDELQTVEPGLYYAVLISTKNHIPDLTIPIKNEWLSTPLPKESFFVTHIINPFNVKDIVSHFNCFLLKPYFDDVVDKVISNIIDGNW